ncbi:EAL domain-containing protein [Pseudomonas sp. PS1]|uniref:EAL domain-containing protein n=1 Tax=Stutzerimonas marianensis TaxID=2929513 RepID=A0A9X1W3U7_9GAMM|nr:EAL domain-containing protein [Pseudomonas marianensis]MCJ0973034.1 EAL domain-containing protein [Pseudomonas marianensis]
MAQPDLQSRLAFTLQSAGLLEWYVELDDSLNDAQRAVETVTHALDACSLGSTSLTEFLEHIHPDDRDEVAEQVAIALSTGEEVRFECRVLVGERGVQRVSVAGWSTAHPELRALHFISQDITDCRRAEAIAHGQMRALELAVAGAPLGQVLAELTGSAQSQFAGVVQAAIMRLDEDGKLRFVEASRLPPIFVAALDGLDANAGETSCGMAVRTGKPFAATDLARDPHWVRYRSVALEHGLHACWSTPIRSVEGEVMGTLACYSRLPAAPSAEEQQGITLLANTAALVVQRDRANRARASVERRMAVNERRFRGLVKATNSLVWSASPDVDIIEPQPDWCDFTGQTFEQARGKGWLQAVHPDDLPEVQAFVDDMRKVRTNKRAEYRVRRADGEYRHMTGHAVPIFDEQGEMKEWSGGLTDITDRRQAEQRLSHMATHDALTGLPNRTYLNDHLRELVNFIPDGQQLMIMLIDLDRFKEVNDSMGHGYGDVLLVQIAHRLREALPSGDLVARLGGDEFVVVAHLPDGMASAERIATDLMRAIQVPCDVLGTRYYPSASMGMCLYPTPDTRIDELLQHADIAMYRAKDAGGTRMQFFSAEMSVETKNRMALELDLREALERGEFVLHYQPRICLDDDSPCGVEALIRWNHPSKGLVPPNVFIPIAETTGLICKIGNWVLRQACEDVQRLIDRLGTDLVLSVNVSPVQLRSPTLCGEVRQALQAAGMDTHRLELELTESGLIEDTDTSQQLLRELGDIGVRLAIDDFGTGYAGIAYLRQYPIDVVKLDRAFLCPTPKADGCLDFIRAVTEMCHSLGMRVVAEGVEDADMLRQLLRSDCDEAQGYLFAQPMPLAKLGDYIIDRQAS